MKKNNFFEVNSYNPFVNLVGLHFGKVADGASSCEIAIDEKHYNPHKVVHGAVIFSLADTSMGAALYTLLDLHQRCATIELKINFLKPASAGKLHCATKVISRGKNIAVLESEIFNNDELIAKAMGSFAIFTLDNSAR